MAKSILITQCLQNDFVAPVLQNDPLPNKLHIGYEESARLLGEDYHNGILMSLMKWAYESAVDENFQLIHIRDWHNKEAQSQKDHLKQFGEHCIQNTRGSEFIFESIRDKDLDIVVDASGLNDFVDTNLQEILDEWKDEEAYVGLVGVWTEAKISFLAYDLVTKYPNFKVGICSALTASSTTHMHYISLDQMHSLLGVTIIPSVAEFGKFLGGEVASLELSSSENNGVFSFSEKTDLDDQDMELLHHLYRNSKKAEFNVLDGGFSGNVVLKSRSYDVNGHEEVPTVVKIGERNSIAGEKVAFEKVKDVLGNSAPNIVGYMETTNRAGIKYRYASMFDEKVCTFQEYYGKSDDQNKINYFLDVIYKKQLGRFYKAASYEKIDLLSYYEFSSKYEKSVHAKVNAIMNKDCSDNDYISIAGKEVYNVAQFYSRDLDTIDHSLLVHSHYMSYVHGDLNGANIIIDGQENVWLIDFFHTHRGHVLKDLIKMENDILYIFMKINSESELNQATEVIDTLIDVEDLWQPLSEKEFGSFQLNKAYKTIKHLREMYPALVDSDRGPYQLWIALLRYAVHTLSFEECNDYQKQLALYSSSVLAQKILQHAKTSASLRVDYTGSFGEQLGMTILPGRKDRNRNLEEDIQSLVEEGVNVVISLITNQELISYGVPDLMKVYKESGIEVNHLEVVDQGIPSNKEMKSLVKFVEDKLQQGKKILIHCVGGVGRTGTLVSCCLKVIKDFSTEQAISEVRQTRSPRAVENRVQEDFVRLF